MTSQMRNSITILIADDDSEDRAMAQEALEAARLANDIRYVVDGQELLDYLFGRGAYSDEKPERPGLILLDINMPKVSGIEALAEIRRDPGLRRIPIVILTTSDSEMDILDGYNLGVSGFITKPVTFDRLVKIMEALKVYWFEIVELPPE